MINGHIIWVSEVVGDKSKAWVAWRDYFEGEARFAWAVVFHVFQGGALTVICGEPGTGKTNEVARELVSAKKAGRKCVGGCSLHRSASLLQERIVQLGGTHQVTTIHKGYAIQVPVHRRGTRSLTGDLFYGDELGQLACEAAGVMGLRWRKGSQVLLSVGLGQNEPVGAGSVGEDLVNWLKANEHRLPDSELRQLEKNFRADDNDARGIVEFFQSVGRGEVPREFGPGMEVAWCDGDELVSGIAASLEKSHGALVLSPTNHGTSEINYTSVLLDRGGGDMEVANLGEFRTGERLLISKAGTAARRAGLRNGDEVVVAADNDQGHNPNYHIQVLARGKLVFVTMREVRRASCRTGHGAQGMEADVVVIALIPSRLSTRRWLYTAASRARKKCILVCTREALKQCIANNPKRRTLLPNLLDKAAAIFGFNGSTGPE